MHEKFARAGPRVAVHRGVVRAARRRTTASRRQIDVDGLYDVRIEALLAHATQVDPTSPFWFGLPDEVVPRRSTPSTTTSWPQTRVESTIPEDDLFAGLR